MTVRTRTIVATTVLLASLAVQTALATRARALEPIPGSITYQGQPKTKLQESPVGSIFSHSFYAGGARYEETYKVKEDRSLELVNRRRLSNR
ncbi:hypothetical protein ACCS54_17750 [Rhizobium johnstonii]|uniref:hypothetical protein n=1 Tax=Rhizobium TaxID=379 RepID=UPI001030E464|nr:hypothetical protein [Rhizobium leguminosarum]TBF43392.1 hypothetical protein ELG91_34705 [Rhizobium leguminosarum]TBF46313.1 hypothetical protein ELG87_34170 [Rhizobium leguminosarum]TBF47729.1 hypothetical protein ELG90_31720 [Rhizobium leguminosarum]TBF65204.1 hypothetical protein ELG84_34690 [Rhizobium leguminosarum]TBF67263.1 hypothetical protein ELG89_29825 [Rhizobium leguminosarum]